MGAGLGKGLGTTFECNFLSAFLELVKNGRFLNIKPKGKLWLFWPSFGHYLLNKELSRNFLMKLALYSVFRPKITCNKQIIGFELINL